MIGSPWVRRGVWLAAASGAALGALQPRWQVAVEPAQVLAGVVRYPPDNPFFIYQAHAWTLLHQLCAAALKLGVREAALSVALGTLVPALIGAGLALWFFACRTSEPGPGAAVVAASLPPLASTLDLGIGVQYPLLVAGNEHTYGMAGLGAAVLPLGLAGHGAFRAAGFTLALAPAVHPSLGAWTIAAFVAAWPWWRGREDSRRLLSGAAWGALVTGLSLAVHLILSHPSPAVDPALRHQHLRSFVALWDGHRQPFSMLWPPALFAALVAAAGLARLAAGGDEPRLRVLLRACVAVGVIGFVAHRAALTDLPLSDLFLVLMPSRFLNVLVIGSVPLLAGTLWAHGPHGHLLLAAVVGLGLGADLGVGVGVGVVETVRLLALGTGLALAILPGARGAKASAVLAVLLSALCGPAIVGGWEWHEEARRWVGAAWLLALASLAPGPLGERLARLPPRRLRRWGQAATGLALAVLVGTATAVLHRASADTRGHMAALFGPADPAVQRAQQRAGAVAVAPGIWMFQLRARRPVLLDPAALDFLPYVPQAAPAMERILREVYGVDLMARAGDELLPLDAVRARWESRTADEWRRLGRDLAFTDVLVYADWALPLPAVVTGPEYALYAVGE